MIKLNDTIIYSKSPDYTGIQQKPSFSSTQAGKLFSTMYQTFDHDIEFIMLAIFTTSFLLGYQMFSILTCR